ncbi:hypothetical protein EVAR_82728_1 [Eumeta japonica]|uniref:Uncharacterized protein n=1 Tax=Eumeta variegata TaxID=151549 RepID=A0A4C1ZKG6_EUMVA|nr:hypothetical protein EVAR_82728_1 [Eumeta japonica]
MSVKSRHISVQAEYGPENLLACILANKPQDQLYEMPVSLPKNFNILRIRIIVSVIFIIDTNELALLAKKYHAAANPTDRLAVLKERASLVYRNIKNNII